MLNRIFKTASTRSIEPNTAVAVVASVLVSAPALAQTEGRSAGRLEEIVVTAQRREQALQDVPIAVSAVSAEGLVTRGINTISDIETGQIPGVLFGTFTNMPSIMKIAVRGVAISDPSQGMVELPVPVYIDGVFLGRAQGAGLDLIEPERIEILRGPQGQLFGRNAEGGVVQYVTRKPSGEFGLRASASYGRYDDQRYRFAIDLPKVAGFSTQFSMIKAEHDPYTEQTDRPQAYNPPSPQTDPALFDSWGARGAVRWENDGGFTADYTYDYTDSDEGQPYLTWKPLPGATPSAPQPPSSDYPDETFSRFYNPSFTTKADGHALTLTYRASDAITLKSISAYRTVSRKGGANLGPALPVNLGSPTGVAQTVAIEDLEQNQKSQEFQFVGSWERFDLTAGATYYYEKVHDGRISELSGPGLAGSALAACGDPCQVGRTRQQATTDSYGVYAQGTYRPAVLDDRLELIAGLRYSDDTKKARRTFNLVAGGDVNQPANFSTSRVDPAVTIKYSWNDDVNTYLRYARGYRAGGANVRSSTFSSFDEEVNEAWEIGLKSQLLDNRLQFNLALYHTTVTDEQLTIQEAPTVNPSLTNTANSDSDKKVKGVEVEALWAPVERLNLGLTFSYMDAKRKSVDIDNPFTPNVVDPTRFWTIFVPKYSGSVFADVTAPMPVGSLAFHIDYAYSDDYWETPFALPLPTIPTNQMPTLDTSQLSARLAWRDIEVGGGKLEIALWGKNLTDDNAVAFQFIGCASGGGHCEYLTVPRTYGVELRYSL